MRNFCLILLNILWSGIVAAQVLHATSPFSTATPYLEPDGRRQALKISETDFVTLAKSRGGMSGPSEFVIERYGEDLNSVFRFIIKTSPTEELKEMYYNGTDLFIFSVIHDMARQTSKLNVYCHDISTGSKKWDRALHEFQVKPWEHANNKGSVKQTFENAINAGLTRSFVAPLQYQYEIRYSPDRKKILTYIFEYGQKHLFAVACLFDENLNKLSEGIVPIDNNFINYDILPNNRGQVFIANVDRLGRMVMIQYNIETKDSKLLDIQYANTLRESLKVHVFSDDIVYLANINTKEGKLIGVMYSRFNFETNLIEKINYHELSDGLKQTVEHSRSANKKGEESWRNYEVTDFLVNEYEKVILVLEKREVVIPGELYTASAVNNIERWKEVMGRVNLEGLFLFSFNRDGQVLWENFYLKSQTNDMNAGMISSSYAINVSDEGRVRLLFAGSDNASGVYNIMKLVEWDELTGARLKDIPLPNDNNLALMKDYAIFWEDKLVVAGRKGVFGKKTFLNLYKF